MEKIIKGMLRIRLGEQAETLTDSLVARSFGLNPSGFTSGSFFLIINIVIGAMRIFKIFFALG